VPRFAYLCIERKVRLCVGEIADRDERMDGWEKKKHVYRKDGARVQDCPNDSHRRSEQKQRRAEGEQDESGRVRNEKNGCCGVNCRIKETRDRTG
jgi:hypothetical protein